MKLLSAILTLAIVFGFLVSSTSAEAAPKKRSASTKASSQPMPAATPAPTPAPQAAAAPIVLPEPTTLLSEAPPYIPRSTEYTVEFGAFQTRKPSVWIAGNLGVHLGRCILSESHFCEQYFDAIAGASVREAQTYGLFLGSVRWQYVDFPKRHSIFWRVFGGASRIDRGADSKWYPAVGAGIGAVTYLHKKVDLRLEARLGAADRIFGQGLVGIQFKTDHLLEYFARKLRDIGVGTVNTAIEATGTAIKATGEGLDAISTEVQSPFRDQSPKPVQPKK